MHTPYKLSCVLLMALSIVLSSCAGMQPGNKQLVSDIVNIGSLAATAKYPQYRSEIALVGDLITANATLGDKELRAIVDAQLAQRIPDPQLRDLVASILARVLERTSGSGQTEALTELGTQLTVQ